MEHCIRESLMNTSQEKTQIGKYAAEHQVAVTVRYYQNLFPMHLVLKRK